MLFVLKKMNIYLNNFTIGQSKVFEVNFVADYLTI